LGGGQGDVAAVQTRDETEGHVIPADTPDEVTISPSSTHRAWRCQWTFGPCSSTQCHANLLDVAGRPSSKPVRANSAASVQTVAVTVARWLASASCCKNGALLMPLRVPGLPGISKISKSGASEKD